MGSGRGIAYSLNERTEILEMISEALLNGAGLKKSCDYTGISVKTYRRWKTNPDKEDGRKGPLKVNNRLSEAETEQILQVCNSSEFVDLPPCKIVPFLADKGIYIASESSFYRVLRSKGQIQHRGRTRPRKSSQKPCLTAFAPNEVWSWDITYLKSSTKGLFYYLYLIIDIYSRKIVGLRVESYESQDYSSALIADTTLKEGVSKDLILHSDNGAPMKGATMLATLQWLGVIPSFSRPSVSNDNPFSESLFKTLKYVPEYPDKGFTSIEEAREWVEKFTDWYNNMHLHSNIKYVTPSERHEGKDKEVLSNRHKIYQDAFQLNPLRWIKGKTRDWTPNAVVSINMNKHNCENHKQIV